MGLLPGPVWTSFENLRTAGANALKAVKDGVVAVLHTKTGRYRIMEENDFQQLYGLARDVERLRGSIRVVISAAQAVEKHHDDETIETLVQAVVMLGQTPIPPTRDGHGPLLPENDIELGESDEVILHSSQLERPLGDP